MDSPEIERQDSASVPETRPRMLTLLYRALALAVVGGAASAACLAGAVALYPTIAFEMDRSLPRITTSGFHGVERVEDVDFAWTARSAIVRLAGVDRRRPWECRVRMRAGRSADLVQPVVTIAVDGISLTSHTVTNDYRDIQFIVPARSGQSGLTLSIATDPPFVPGPADVRELGVQVDRLTCQPGGAGSLFPPSRALAAAAFAGAAFGAAFGLLGFSLPLAIGTLLFIAVAQAIPLSTVPGPYGPYVEALPRIAFWTALTMTTGVLAIQWWRGQPLSVAARFVVAASAAVLFIDLSALLHPVKQVVDAVFHAHRLAGVLGGRYFFTQPMPSGVEFPYAIGLYVFTAPWAPLARDHVALLRVVVAASHVVAGMMLYPMVVRAWGDKAAGSLAVVLYHLAPLPYIVIGNANLTYAFGQSVALVTMAAATLWSLSLRNLLPCAALFAVASLAFLSHVGVFPVLLATLLALSARVGLANRGVQRGPATAIAAIAILAAVFSVVTYYGQFGEAYATLRRVRAPATAAPTAGAPEPGAHTRPQPADEIPDRPLPLRGARALALTVADFGWPMVVLAAIGAWRLGVTAAGDRLRLSLVAWALAWVAFVSFSVATPVEPEFQKYSDEFISRVNFATLPAVAILAARAVGWGWTAGPAPRIVSALLLAAAVVIGARQWMGWLN